MDDGAIDDGAIDDNEDDASDDDAVSTIVHGISLSTMAGDEVNGDIEPLLRLFC